MFVRKVTLLNWRNFRTANAEFADVTYILGPNAAGKSNFLDVFRFLRDIAKPNGGGLQKAIIDRGGLKKIRCLHARAVTDVGIDIEISESSEANDTVWRYKLQFNSERKGKHRPHITQEIVVKIVGGLEEVVLSRPNKSDVDDPDRLTQTAIEQIQANQQFRYLADFFSRITYVHLVPQLLKFGEQIGGKRLDDDPFGQGFLERLAKSPEATRATRLKRIEDALKTIIPHMEELSFERDTITGAPHLEARFKHHRPRGAIQREDQFSDGTLRLISLFWLLLEGQSFLLLEEPELSLNEEIVEKLPYLIERVQRRTKKKRQVLITTHSHSLLSNAGIGGKSLLIFLPSSDGTAISPPNSEEMDALNEGFSAAEVVLPRTQRLQKNSNSQYVLGI
jgi:predicted ATPase